MFNSSFLLIILLAFKHTHLISCLDVLPCIPLRLLSSCTGWVGAHNSCYAHDTRLYPIIQFNGELVVLVETGQLLWTT